jgi:hypothetical protein
MKICYICKQEKEIEEFYIIKNKLKGPCKKCHGIKVSESYYKYHPKKEMLSEEQKKDRLKEYKRLYKINKKATDPLFKIKENLRRRTLKAFKTKGWVKSGGTETLLQGTYDEVFNHIEGLFTEGMTWNNQGRWHIDHIIPLASAKTQEEIIKLFNYKNLQPLWAIDNILKSNK